MKRKLSKSASLRTMRLRGVFLRFFVSSLVLVGAVLSTFQVRADEAQERIDALVAKNEVAKAMPIAIERARLLTNEVPAWRQVLLIAGWTSNNEAALEALENLVRLNPDDRNDRRALAQRLLWNKQTASALPHVRWLLAGEQEREPSVLEVAVWVLLGQGARDEARDALKRWIRISPSDLRPRRILADLTHWSSRWREARDQYEMIGQVPSQEQLVKTRMTMLRHDHPNEVHLDGVHWRDNFDISYAALISASTVQLPGRFVMFPRAEMGRWQQQRPVLSGPNTGQRFDDHINVAGGSLRLRHETWDGVWPEVVLGAEGDSESNFEPVGGIGTQLSIAGRLFGKVYLEHDRHRVSLDAARRNISWTGPGWLLYFEPSRWLFLSSTAALQWISDGNFRTRGLLIVGVHNPGMLQIEPRVFAQHDGYRDQVVNASPYFTPTEKQTYGGELAARYRIDTRLYLEGSFGIVKQGTITAWRPGGLVRVELAEHLRLAGGIGYVGSPQYNQTRVDVSLGYLF